MDWSDLTKNLGFPVVILIAIGIGFWRAAKWFAPRAETWMSRVIDSHEKLTENCISIGSSNNETLRKLETIAAAQTLSIHRIESHIASYAGKPAPNQPGTRNGDY